MEQTIGRISETLRANDAPGFKWEIIVCDNDSTDDTAKIAEQAGARVVGESKCGIACARNAGAQAAQGEWLLLIDADSHPSPKLMSANCLNREASSVAGRK